VRDKDSLRLGSDPFQRIELWVLLGMMRLIMCLLNASLIIDKFLSCAYGTCDEIINN